MMPINTVNRFSVIAKLLALGVLAAFPVGVHAIETEKVDLGLAGNYDGTVRIERDSMGRMIFRDHEVTTAVPLSDLLQGKSVHSELLGLSADDHTQYLNAARHATTHSAAFNEALDIGIDVGGNMQLGDHLQDSSIHINRNSAENIFGNWVFWGSPVFRENLTLNAAGGTGDQRIRFEDGTVDAEILWNDAQNRFELNRDLAIPQTLHLTSMTQGSALFLGASGAIVQDNTNFQWDDVNNELQLSKLVIGASVANELLEVTNSTGDATIDPTTIRVGSSTSGSAWSTSSPWGTLDFYSADGSGTGVGASVRARIGARMSSSNGGASALGIYVIDGTGAGTGLNEVIHASGSLFAAVGAGISAGQTATGSGDLLVRDDLEVDGEIDQDGTGINTFAGLGRFDNGTAGTNNLADGPGDLYVEEDLEVDRFASVSALSVGSATSPGTGNFSTTGDVEHLGEKKVVFEGRLVRRPLAVSITAVSSQISANRAFVNLQSAGGTYTLTSTPTIPDPTDAGGIDGYTLMISKNDSGTVTLQDEGTLAGSNVELGASTRAIGRGDILELAFFDGAWREVAFINH